MSLPLLEYDKMDFVEAIEELASLQGVEVPRKRLIVNIIPTIVPIIEASVICIS